MKNGAVRWYLDIFKYTALFGETINWWDFTLLTESWGLFRISYDPLDDSIVASEISQVSQNICIGFNIMSHVHLTS